MKDGYILRAKTTGKETMPVLAGLLGIDCLTSLDTLPEAKYAFRWGCVSCNLGNTKVINKVSAIEKTGDKGVFRKELSDNDLAPKTFLSLKDYLESSMFIYPFIVRPEHHSRSKDLHFCKNPSEVYEAWTKVGKGYISEYIPKQKEYRVFVIQNRIAWMIEKYPNDPEDISWGCVTEGMFSYIDWSSWPKNVSECALKSMKLSGLDFGAVDIIVLNDKVCTMEINTAPYLTPYYIKCIAKTFKHIIKNGRDHFQDPVDYSWKNVIHPAIQKELENI